LDVWVVRDENGNLKSKSSVFDGFEAADERVTSSCIEAASFGTKGTQFHRLECTHRVIFLARRAIKSLFRNRKLIVMSEVH
jgi:hypothetical protein